LPRPEQADDKEQDREGRCDQLDDLLLLLGHGVAPIERWARTGPPLSFWPSGVPSVNAKEDVTPWETIRPDRVSALTTTCVASSGWPVMSAARRITSLRTAWARRSMHDASTVSCIPLSWVTTNVRVISARPRSYRRPSPTPRPRRTQRPNSALETRLELL